VAQLHPWIKEMRGPVSYKPVHKWNILQKKSSSCDFWIDCCFWINIVIILSVTVLNRECVGFQIRRLLSKSVLGKGRCITLDLKRTDSLILDKVYNKIHEQRSRSKTDQVNFLTSKKFVDSVRYSEEVMAPVYYTAELSSRNCGFVVLVSRDTRNCFSLSFVELFNACVIRTDRFESLRAPRTLQVW
jgi:hypothetical protein